MPSSNRSAGILSTASGSLAFLAVTLLAGCPNPAEKFEDFENRIPDAGQVITFDAPPLTNIPDVNGTFLMGFKIHFVPQPIQLVATVVMTPITETSAELDMTLRFLTTGDRQITGDPLVFENIAVGETGEFEIDVGDLAIPSAANPTGSNATAEDVVLFGSIKSTDRVCGTIDGMVTMPVALPLCPSAQVCSTFGQIRVQAGQTGDQLPQPEINCP